MQHMACSFKISFLCLLCLCFKRLLPIRDSR